MKDERPTSQAIAHQSISFLGILFIVVPFAILVIAAIICMTSRPPDDRTTEEIQRDHEKWQREHNANRP